MPLFQSKLRAHDMCAAISDRHPNWDKCSARNHGIKYDVICEHVRCGP
jgi:hypothetical protein